MRAEHRYVSDLIPITLSFYLKQIVYVKIPPGRGCGFVQYVQRQSAETAISRMQGGDVKGCKVRLSWGRTSPTRVGPLTGPPGVYAAGPNYGPGPASSYPPQYQVCISHHHDHPPPPFISTRLLTIAIFFVHPHAHIRQQYYTPQVTYAAPPGSYAPSPYQYQQGPYTHMTYPTYGPGPGYGQAGPAYVGSPYSPSVDMGAMGGKNTSVLSSSEGVSPCSADVGLFVLFTLCAGMGGDRSPSGGSSLPTYGTVSYFDRSIPDPNHGPHR